MKPLLNVLHSITTTARSGRSILSRINKPQPPLPKEGREIGLCNRWRKVSRIVYLECEEWNKIGTETFSLQVFLITWIQLVHPKKWGPKYTHELPTLSSRAGPGIIGGPGVLEVWTPQCRRAM